MKIFIISKFETSTVTWKLNMLRNLIAASGGRRVLVSVCWFYRSRHSANPSIVAAIINLKKPSTKILNSSNLFEHYQLELVRFIFVAIVFVDCCARMWTLLFVCEFTKLVLVMMYLCLFSIKFCWIKQSHDVYVLI